MSTKTALTPISLNAEPLRLQAQNSSESAVEPEVLLASKHLEPELLWTKFRLRWKLRWDFSGLQWDFEIERQF